MDGAHVIVMKIVSVPGVVIALLISAPGLMTAWSSDSVDLVPVMFMFIVTAVVASFAITGPRSDPPIPMFTTFLMRAPVKPLHSPLRTLSANAAIASNTSCTSGTTGLPSTATVAPFGARSAVCSTARRSVVARVLVSIPAPRT